MVTTMRLKTGTTYFVREVKKEKLIEMLSALPDDSLVSFSPGECWLQIRKDDTMTHILSLGDETVIEVGPRPYTIQLGLSSGPIETPFAIDDPVKCERSPKFSNGEWRYLL